MRREATLGFIVVSLAATGALFAGCASFEADICAYAKCDADGATADGTTPSEGGGPDAAPDGNVPNPPGCDDVKAPLKNPEKCFTDDTWAFVAPNGNDANPGTKEKPYKTVGKALSGSKLLVVACEGTYGEGLTIERTVGLYGAVDCKFTKAGNPTTLESGSAVGLTVSRGIVTLNGVSVTAKPGATPGESSIGILVQSGATLTATGGTVTSGAGAGGGEGTTISNYDVALDPSDPKIKGNNGSGNTGGAKQTCGGLCMETPAVAVEGGEGGIGAGAGGSPGGDGKTVVAGAPATAGKGGLFDGTDCANGRTGSAAPAANGGAGATSPGSIEGGKWQATRGAAGTTARSGQGGGGGSGGRDPGSANAGGGGGGCGGCGGGKGQGGQSGGSSFGVLSLGGTVTLQNITVKAGTGGKGGQGGAGQVGQAGGIAGSQAAAGIGCPGGAGGQGGHGGGGGGGAGGHSVAVAYTGTRPEQKSVTAETASIPAKGGDPGTTGAGATAATSGAEGKTGAELELR